MVSIHVSRSCYKCGRPGHYADGCPSAERLCYNCYQPGHEKQDCPLPQKQLPRQSQQCYACFGIGHIQVDCPTVRLNPNLRLQAGPGGIKGCFKCSQPGHKSRNCPMGFGPGFGPGLGPGAGPRLGQGGGGGIVPGLGPKGHVGKSLACFKCGNPNHLVRDCSEELPKCYACGKVDGHISEKCTISGKRCYTCQKVGHIQRDCPDTKPAIPTTDTADKVVAVTKEAVKEVIKEAVEEVAVEEAGKLAAANALVVPTIS